MPLKVLFFRQLRLTLFSFCRTLGAYKLDTAFDVSLFDDILDLLVHKRRHDFTFTLFDLYVPCTVVVIEELNFRVVGLIS